MGSELNIKATDQELAYRSKNHCDLKAFEKRELFCCSCGNILSHDFRHVYSHPILGILQCENCKNHFKTVTFSLDKDDSVKHCHICGRDRASSYSCVKRNCPYEFCKTCIKRNVPQSLVDAESGKWKCFACNTKPLWKLRGACAAVMSSLPKRTKAKKVKSRERSRDREDESSDLKGRSYVRRVQLEKNNKIRKRLTSICDTESPNQGDKEESKSFFKTQNNRGKTNHGNSKIRSNEKFPRGEASARASRDASSDDTDIEEIVCLKPKKSVKTKFQRENSTDRMQVRKSKKKSEESVRERKNKKNDIHGYSKRRGRGSPLGENDSSQELDDSSDESEVDEEEPKQSSKTKSRVGKNSSNSKTRRNLYESSEDETEAHKNENKRTSTAKTMAARKKQKSKRAKAEDKIRSTKTVSQRLGNDEDGSSSDSSGDDSVTASMKKLMPTAFAKKPGATEKNNSVSSRRKDSSDEEEPSSMKSSSSKSEKPIMMKSSKALTNKKQSMRAESIERDDTASENPKKSSKSLSTGRNVSVILSDIAKCVQKKTRQSLEHLQLTNQKQGSDSSSSKEFRTSKGCRRSNRRMQEIEEDPGSPPEISKDDTKDEISKEQSIALKKSVRHFFADLKTTTRKLLSDIEYAEKKYCAKDESMRRSMRPDDANRMILETKNVVTTWKQCVEQGETKMTDYYDGWCKKTRQKNIWKSPKTADDKAEKPSTSGKAKKKMPKLSEDSDSESSNSTKIVSSKENKPRTKSPVNPESPVVTNGNKPVVVSDCDSDEIFSDDETRMSINKSNAASPNKSIKDKSANLKSSKKGEDSSKRKLTESSDEAEIAVNENKDADDEPAKRQEIPDGAASPTMSQFSGRSDAEDEHPSQKAGDLRDKSASPVDRNEGKENMNKSIDPFESSGEDTSSDKPSSYQQEIERIQKKNSVKRTPSDLKSKDTISSSDSESDNSKKSDSRVSLPAADKSEDSGGEKSKSINAAEHKDKDNEDQLSDAKTEEYVDPTDAVKTVEEKDAVASDTENPEISATDALSVEPSESGSVVNCDVTSVTTEVYCSSSGKQSDAPPDEIDCSSIPAADDDSTDNEHIEKREKAAEESEKMTKKEKKSKNRKKDNSDSRSDSTHRSSLDTVLADDLDESAKKSPSRTNSGASSDLSDGDNALAKRKKSSQKNSGASSDSSDGEKARARRKKSPSQKNSDANSDLSDGDKARARRKKSPSQKNSGANSDLSDGENARAKRNKSPSQKNSGASSDASDGENARARRKNSLSPKNSGANSDALDGENARAKRKKSLSPKKSGTNSDASDGENARARRKKSPSQKNSGASSDASDGDNARARRKKSLRQKNSDANSDLSDEEKARAKRKKSPSQKNSGASSDALDGENARTRSRRSARQQNSGANSDLPDGEKAQAKRKKSPNQKNSGASSDALDGENARARRKRSPSQKNSGANSDLSDGEKARAKRKKSPSQKNSSASSDSSDGENARARDAMLMSSNSEDSSDEQRSKTQKSNPKESSDSPLTPPESDSKSDKSSKTLRKNATEQDSGGNEKTSDSDKPRKKRSKFRITKNRYYMADDQLKQKCKVRVERLEEKILERYSRALGKSKKYVESKEIKRLVALDGLDKDKKRVVENSSDDEDSAKNLRKEKRKSRAKKREETLMDHLKKIENGEGILLSSESEGEGSKSGKNDKIKEKGEDSLFAEANRMAKKRMLDDSSESGGEPPTSDAKDDEAEKKTKKVVKKRKADKSSEDEEKKKEKAEKGRWRKNKLLTLKISDSDSEEECKKFNLSQEKLAKKKKSQGSDSDEQSSSTKKKRVRRRVLHSDSDAKVSPISNSDSDSSRKSLKKQKKKKKDDSSDEEKEDKKKSRKRSRKRRSSDSSTDEKRPKTTRRKRIKTAGSDSDSDEDLDNSQGTPGKSGRKNIRKVLRDKQVAEDTKQAAKDEEERLRRIADRQKLYNEMYEVRLAGEEKVEKLVLDFDEDTKEPLVSVDEGLVKRLKPHQAQGIKFMWDACFESLERTKSTKGSGCILAHCMGLGKTFQIVTLAHTLLLHHETGIKTVLVVCPLSTVLNWANEFKIWLADLPTGDDVEIYELTKMKKNYERKYQLERWRETGGVMIIGYEMFRNLSNGGKKVRKNIQESFIKSLVDPGPDMIVCDEGHLLKNEDTALSKAMRKVKTLRRIVLTGTPLQNNLIEYHCMVQFVKPNLLGTKREFMNRFENPITNGQFDDSTEYDVKLMKKRAHVLHKMLEGSVQRFDYSVLTPFLPPKQEYVIFVKLTEVQIKMYQHYLENYARRHRGVGGSLFADFQALQRIWTHPFVMQMNAEKVERANEKKRLDATDSEGSLRDFIDDGSDTAGSSNSSDVQSVSGSDDEKNNKKPKRGTRANPVVEEPVPLPPAVEPEENNDDETGWWTKFITGDEDYEDIRISSKLLILFRILKESEQIGDKVLVFSQSLYSLSLIEKFLGMIDEETQKGNHPENLDGHSGSWALGLDYFRLDGQSSADNRRLWCNIFNRPTNTRARLFLISTRAGGLGINLTAANRVIIFDASWNPSHDVQSIFRIYRFGQKKPCYVYRLLAAGTMEEKIYNRQVTKLSLSCRVVDEQQIERHYSNNALAELYKLELPSETENTLNLPKDRLLAEIFLKYKHVVENYHEHDSLLENQAGEELDEEERQQAWLEYEEEKKGKRAAPPMPFMNYQDQLLMQQINLMNLAQQNAAINNPAMLADIQSIQRLMEKDYPGLPEAQQKLMASKAVYEMYNYVEKQAMANQSLPMMNMPAVGSGQFGFDNQVQGPPPILGHPSMDTLRMYQQSLAQAQNGQMNNYPNNQGHLRDAVGPPRSTTIGQPGQMTGLSTISSTIDDDIMEIPSSPDRNPVPSVSAPGGSRKSKEE